MLWNFLYTCSIANMNFLSYQISYNSIICYWHDSIVCYCNIHTLNNQWSCDLHYHWQQQKPLLSIVIIHALWQQEFYRSLLDERYNKECAQSWQHNTLTYHNISQAFILIFASKVWALNWWPWFVTTPFIGRSWNTKEWHSILF